MGEQFINESRGLTPTEKSRNKKTLCLTFEIEPLKDVVKLTLARRIDKRSG